MALRGILEWPHAILEWPNGLDAPPVIRVFADSEEQSAVLLEQLERLFKVGLGAS